MRLRKDGEFVKCPRLVAVVVAYNERDAVRQCVDSVRAALPDWAGVVVFDNTPSAEGRAAMCAMLPEGVPYRTVDENVGYAGAGAYAMAEFFDAGAEHVVILNQDLTVAADFFEHMARAADAPGVGVVGAFTMNRAEPDRVTSVGGALLWPWGHDREPTRKDDPALTYVDGSAFLVTRAAYERVGVFDPEFVIYFEETDYCHRVLDAGLRVVVSDAKVYHSAERHAVYYAFWMVRNRIRFFRRHGKPMYVPAFAAYMLGYSIPALAWFYRDTPMALARHVRDGVLWNVRDARDRGFWLPRAGPRRP